MDHNRVKLFQLIKGGNFEFYEEDWREISKEAKDLISNLLVLEYDKRWSAKQALHSSWFTTEEQHLKSRNLTKSLANVIEMNSSNKSDVWGTSPKNHLDDEDDTFKEARSSPI